MVFETVVLSYGLTWANIDFGVYRINSARATVPLHVLQIGPLQLGLSSRDMVYTCVEQTSSWNLPQ